MRTLISGGRGGKGDSRLVMALITFMVYSLSSVELDGLTITSTAILNKKLPIMSSYEMFIAGAVDGGAWIVLEEPDDLCLYASFSFSIFPLPILLLYAIFEKVGGKSEAEGCAAFGWGRRTVGPSDRRERYTRTGRGSIF